MLKILPLLAGDNPSTALVSIVFTLADDGIVITKSSQRLHGVPRKERDAYSEAIANHKLENLQRILKRSTAKLEEGNTYSATIHFNAKYVMNLWQIEDWMVIVVYEGGADFDILDAMVQPWMECAKSGAEVGSSYLATERPSCPSTDTPPEGGHVIDG